MNRNTLTWVVLIVIVIGGVLALVAGNRSQQSREATSTQPTATSTNTDKSLSYEFEPGTYQVQTDQSTLRWTATKELVANYTDTGTFPVSGQITIDESGLTNAQLTLDIADLNVTSVSGPGGTDRLAEHLRSEDFFAVDSYPTSTLRTTAITKATASPSTYNITANLTLKGRTNKITFPAMVGMQGDKLIVRADTEIDRTRWNVRYGSDKFFDNLGNNVISDTVGISARLQAVPTDTQQATSSQTR